MSLLTSLIGGSSQSSKASSNSTANSFLSPDQLPFLRDLWGGAANLMPTSTFVGANPTQQQAWQMGMNAAGGANNLFGQMQGANSYLMNPANIFNPYAKAATDYAASGLQDQFRNTVNDLRGQGIAAGQWTTGEGKGTFNTSVNNALNPFTRAMSGLYTNMGQDIYNTGINNINQAVNRIPTIANLGFAGSDYLRSIGGEQRAIDQAGALEPWQRLGYAQNIFGAPISLSQSQSSSTSNSRGQSTPGLLSAGMDMAGLYMLMNPATAPLIAGATGAGMGAGVGAGIGM